MSLLFKIQQLIKLKHLFTHLTFTLFISIFFFGSTLFAQNMEDNKTELSVEKQLMT